jgi:tetratricopeptide (TPR) repeat protein
MLSSERVFSMGQHSKALMSVVLCVFLCPVRPSIARTRESQNGKSDRPAEFEAVDPEVRQLLNESRSSCDQVSINDQIERVQKAIKIADSHGLIGDRALAEAMLASAYIGQAEIELAFITFQRALQDAIDSKNAVLEADILISLASEAQLKGNIPQGIDLTSRAVSISEKSGSLFEKARALGELGRMKLLLGKSDEAAQSIDEALQIDKLNGYRFEGLHLVYRGYYLGLTGKVDQAMDSLTQAKTKALLVRDAYSFIMAENSYAFGLAQKGRADEAIADLSLLKEGKFQKFVQDAKEQEIGRAHV